MSQPQNNNQFSTQDFLTITPAKVKERIEYFRNMGTKDGAETAQALENLPKEVYELTPNEKKLLKLVEYLRDKTKLDPKAIEVFVISFMQAVHTNTILRIFELMSDDVRTSWNEFIDTDPNEFQIIKMLDFFCTKTVGRTFDELFNEGIGVLIDSYLSTLESGITLTERMDNLSEEETKQVEKLINENKLEEAIIILSK